MEAPPTYRDWAEVPEGLQPESDLRFAGLTPVGTPVAYLELRGRTLALYRTRDAVAGERRSEPERPSGGRSARPAAPQLAVLPGAGMLQRTSATPGTSRSDAHARIAELLRSGCVLLDTETTGLGYDAEVIEIAVLSSGGETLLDTLVRPRASFIPARVSAVHGITMDDVIDAPSFDEVYDELLRVTAEQAVLAWNAPFDERMVRQSAVAWGRVERVKNFECSMRLYALASGLSGGRAQLERAARLTGALQSAPQSHRALDDTRLSLEVLRRTLG